MTKRGQNRLVQITLHVHTHTIGRYGIGVNRLGASPWRGCPGSSCQQIAVNVAELKSLTQTMMPLGRNPAG